MAGICDTHAGEEKCLQNLGGKAVVTDFTVLKERLLSQCHSLKMKYIVRNASLESVTAATMKVTLSGHKYPC